MPKSYKKQAHEFHQKLPRNNPVMRSAVTMHQLLRVIKSPKTQDVMPTVLANSREFHDVCHKTLASNEETQRKDENSIRRDVRLVVQFRA